MGFILSKARGFLSIRRLVLLLAVLLFVTGATLSAYSDNIVYKYDSLNRLIEVDYPDKKILYTYDAAGNRICVEVVYLVPAPSAGNLNRTTAIAGGTAFTLIIDGSGFDSNSIAQWNGLNRVTTFISNTRLAVQILASDVASPGTATLTVLNPNNGTISNGQLFAINAPPPLGQTFGINGQVTYLDSITAVNNVTLSLTGSQSAGTSTDPGGNYGFIGLTPGGAFTITPSKAGEANGITAFDASLAARFAIGLVPLTPNQQIAGDASNNGTVTAFDASEIARTALGISNPGIAGTWKFAQPNRIYENLSGSQSNQNYAAILVGDVSGNWTPPAGPSRSRALSSSAVIPVSLPNRNDPPGGTSTISVAVGNLSNQNVFAWQFDFTFDPNVLQPQNPAFDSAGTLSTNLSVNANTSTPGHILINGFSSNTPMTGQGVLLNLKFNVVGAGGSQTPLTWQTFDFNEGNPIASTTNGQFTVGSPTAASASISGQVLTAEGVPVSGTTITVTGGSRLIRAITDRNGFYRVDNLESGKLYSVAPSRANFVFGPNSRSFSLLADKTDAVFTGTPLRETANPLDSPEFFVRQQYVDFLEREPDQGGLDYWSAELRACNGDERCLNARRIGVSAAFFVEREFQQTGSFVYRLYKGSLGRRPHYVEFAADRGRLDGAGTVEEKQQAFADEWVRRDLFKQQYPDNLSAAEFVSKLFDTAGLQPFTAERQQEIDAVAGGKTRAQASRDMIEIAEVKTREYNPSFVLMEYFGYLQREPDQGGYDFWLDVLNNREPNNYRGMVCSFITSAEYQKRFSSVVLHSDAECATVAGWVRKTTTVAGNFRKPKFRLSSPGSKTAQ